MARRRQEERRGQCIAWHEAMESFLLPCTPRVVPGRDRVPARGPSSGAAVDGCRDTTAWGRRAARGVDGDVVDVARALSVPSFLHHPMSGYGVGHRPRAGIATPLAPQYGSDTSAVSSSPF